MKFIASMLVLCIALSLGSALAQTVGADTSQMGKLYIDKNISNKNISAFKNISTLADKKVNISQLPGGDVRWIFPGERKLDPEIFGTPQKPLGFEPGIGVPIKDRLVSHNGKAFVKTKEPTPFSDNYTFINGSFSMNLTDKTPVDINQSKDTAKAEFNFTNPTGKIRYRVVLKNVIHVGQNFPVLGGVIIDGRIHGKSSIESRLIPTVYSYGSFWGVGELYINNTLVSKNRVIHAMATERLMSSDKEGYRLLFDRELPHQGIETELLLPDKVMSANGTMQEESVPTNYTLPNGQEQHSINIMFENSQLEGLKILNYNNTTMSMPKIIGIDENVTGTITGNMTEMTGMESITQENMTQENITRESITQENITQGNITQGNMTQENIAGNITQENITEKMDTMTEKIDKMTRKIDSITTKIDSITKYTERTPRKIENRTRSKYNLNKKINREYIKIRI